MKDRKLNRSWHLPIRYPDPAIEIIDDSFRKYVVNSACIERIWTGGRWTEGPVWFGDLRSLIWSDIPNDRMLRWCEETNETSIFRSPAENANGNTRDHQGRMITCEHATRRVTRTEHDGSITTLIDSFEGKRLNAPNDVVVNHDGSIWFTDPGYGIHWHYEGNKSPFELPTRTYRFDPTADSATVVDESLAKPNGLAFSPDHKTLYISDTGASHIPNHPRAIHAFNLNEQNQLTNRRQFCDFQSAGPDGFRVDSEGNLWCAAAWGGEHNDGVFVFNPDGKKIGAIHLPEGAANLCFGGVKRNRLFITAGQSVYSLYVETQGVAYYEQI